MPRWQFPGNVIRSIFGGGPKYPVPGAGKSYPVPGARGNKTPLLPTSPPRPVATAPARPWPTTPQRPGPVASHRQPTPTNPWEARDKDVAREDGRQLGDLADTITRVRVEWVDAPGSSHLDSFGLVDYSRTRSVIRDRNNHRDSEIHVRFKAKGNWSETHYVYYLSDHSRARGIYIKLLNASQPGKVVHAYLEAQEPYMRLAGGPI